MKFGPRIPSLKMRIAARTSPARFVHHSLGLKAPRGWGWLLALMALAGVWGCVAANRAPAGRTMRKKPQDTLQPRAANRYNFLTFMH